MGGRVSSPRVIGREEELAQLRDALDDAADGQPRIVLISGDAGVGKTRLVAEFVAGLDPVTTPVLAGGCLAIRDGGLPYAPLTEAVRRFVRESEPERLDAVLGPARSELARLLPALTSRASDAARPPAARVDQARLFELVLGLLGRLVPGSGQRAAILVIEDLHWLDDATRDLLTFLVRNLVHERLLIVATHRADAAEAPPWLGPWLAELERLPAVGSIALAPLSDDAVASMLESILGGPPPASLRRSIVARAGGNAFFAEELLAAARGGGQGTLPRTVREVLIARLAGLSAPATEIVRILATAGREADERLLAVTTARPVVEIEAAVHEALDRHLVVADPGEGVVALRHVLLQEAIIDGLLAGERRRLHEALAEALARNPDLADPSPAGAASELAHHWAAAGRTSEAFTASLSAASASEAVFAFGDALRHRRRALELWERLPAEERPDRHRRLELLLEAEAAADLAGEAAVAQACIEEAQQLVDPAIDPRTAGVIEGRRAYHAWLAGRSDDELAAYRRAVDLVPATPPSPERARVLRGYGGALMGKGRYRESIAVCEEAIEVARAAGVPIEEGRALDMLGMDLVGLGQVEAGIDRLEAACRIAREHDPLDGLVVALYNLGYHLMLVDRLEAADRAVREGIDVARVVGLERRFGISLRALGADVLLRVGRWPEAEALVHEAQALDPAGHGGLYLRIVRTRLATARGSLDEAREALRDADELAGTDVDYDLLAYLRIADAELSIVDGRPADAAAAVDDGLRAVAASDDRFLTASLVTLGMRAAADRAEAARAWQDAEVVTAAEADADRLSRLLGADRDPDPTLPATSSLEASRAQVEAEHRRVRRVSDPAAWRTVAEAWRAAEQPAAATYADLRAAEAILLAGGDRRVAAETLSTATEVARALGATPLLDAAMTLARRARLAVPEVEVGEPGPERPLPPGTTGVEAARHGDGTRARTTARAAARAAGAGGPAAERSLEQLGLSDREIEVLTLVAAGRTNGQIARVLFISPKTASVHVSHILAKLGAANRVEAAMVAARLGLTTDSAAERAGPGRSSARRAARAFLFTDMVRSTSLLEAIGDEAWADLRAWHDATLRALFAAHAGDEVDHAGDGFFVVFAMAGPAVACAVAIQRALADHRRTAGFAPAVRIGVHVGEATRTEQGYTGRDVHLAARIAARAGGGEILASAAALEAAGNQATGAIELVDLPGISEPVGIGRVPWAAAVPATHGRADRR